MSSVTVPDGRYLLLHQLRAIAALSVVYSHLVGNFLQYSNQEWWLDEQVHRFVLNPLQFHDNGGWLGVSLFFFISGFVVTASATRSTRWGFLSRRLVRLYPTLVVVVAIIGLVAWAGVQVWTVERPVTLLDAFGNASLAVFVFNDTEIFSAPWLPAAWTLVTEILFYIVMVAVMPLLHRNARWAPWLTMAVIVALGFAFSLTEGSDPMVAYASLLPFMAIGQATYLFSTRALPVVDYVALLIVAPATAVFLGRNSDTALTGPHRLNYALVTVLALALFIAAVLLEGKIRPSRILSVIGSRSYSLYLVHIPVGYTVLIALWESGTSAPVTVLAALVATALVAELVYHSTERPTRALVARLRR